MGVFMTDDVIKMAYDIGFTHGYRWENHGFNQNRNFEECKKQLDEIMKKKETHGGARKGAGRPKTKEPTKVMRVPLSLVPKVKQWIDNLNRK